VEGEDEEIQIKPERRERAEHVCSAYIAKLTEDEYFQVVNNLGWVDQVQYSEEGRLQIGLTDLQTVALAAALLAYEEAKLAGVA